MEKKEITEHMIKTLKRYGNFYILDVNSINLPQLEALVGFQLIVRPSSDNIGYVLERK